MSRRVAGARDPLVPLSASDRLAPSTLQLCHPDPLAKGKRGRRSKLDHRPLNVAIGSSQHPSSCGLGGYDDAPDCIELGTTPDVQGARPARLCGGTEDRSALPDVLLANHLAVDCAAAYAHGPHARDGQGDEACHDQTGDPYP